MKQPTVEGLAINGIPIASRMLALTSDGVKVSAPEPAFASTSIPGRNGVHDSTLTDSTGSAYIADRTVTLGLWTAGTESDIRRAQAWLSGLTGTQVTVSWRTLPGEWKGRATAGEWSEAWGPRGLTSATTTLTVDAQPLLEGAEHSATVGNGETITIWVDGNRECWPRMTLTPYGSPGSMSLAINGSAWVISTGGTITATAVADSDPDARSTLLGGMVAAPTLASDWTPLRPGRNTVTATGCTAIIAWRPRTLI